MNPVRYMAIKYAVAMLVILLIVAIQKCFATHPHVQVQVANKQQLVVTPFAIPVAVPVATVQPIAYGYSYQQAAGAYLGQANYRSPESDFVERLAAEMLRQQEAKGNSLPGGAVLSQSASLITQSCARCHAKENPDGGFHLSQLNTDAGSRLAAKRITAEDPNLRMPKGVKLDPNQTGNLLQAILAVPDSSQAANFKVLDTKPAAVKKPVVKKSAVPASDTQVMPVDNLRPINGITPKPLPPF